MLRRKHFYSAYPPLLLHRFSIACPSLLHRFDGLSMDYRWIIFGGRGKEQEAGFGGKKPCFLSKTLWKGYEKSPHRQEKVEVM